MPARRTFYLFTARVNCSGTAARRESKNSRILMPPGRLSSMTQEQANTLVINADENILQGWLDLARLV